MFTLSSNKIKGKICFRSNIKELLIGHKNKLFKPEKGSLSLFLTPSNFFFQDGDPCRVGIAMTDMSTGLYAAVSILASLVHRDRTSQGQYIDCNLLSTQVFITSVCFSVYKSHVVKQVQ